MANANINIRTDSETKAKAQELFAELGMDMSTAINLFLKQALEFNGIPFVIQRKYNEETERVIRDTKLGINLSRPYNSVQELMEDLNADD